MSKSCFQPHGGAPVAVGNVAGKAPWITAYVTSREITETVFGRDLSALLTEETWKTVVREPLTDPDFVQQALEMVLAVEGEK